MQYDLIQKALTELGHEEPKNYFDINPISFDGPVKLPNKKGVSWVVSILLVQRLNQINQSSQLLNFVWCTVHS